MIDKIIIIQYRDMDNVVKLLLLAVDFMLQDAMEAAAKHSKSLKKHTSQVCYLYD